MLRRIEERVKVDPKDFGATEEERNLIIKLHESKKDLPKGGTILDANQPLDLVVKDILKEVGEF